MQLLLRSATPPPSCCCAAPTMHHLMNMLFLSSINPHHTLLSIVICIGVTIWWCRRQRGNSRRLKETTAASSDVDNGCNNPNCLRCHSSAHHHVKTFQANVTMLRRLVKLEPDLFEGMRDGIWSAIDEMEGEMLLADDTHDDGNSTRGLLMGMKIMIQQLRRMLTNQTSTTSDEAKVSAEDTTTKSSTSPLSPQEGQDPTVFFLPGLEATPMHDSHQCTIKNCPCIRLWKSMPRNQNDPPIQVTGDIDSLQRGYDVIRKELLEFISNQTQNGDASFSPFDSKVYTNARLKSNSSSSPEWSSIYLYHQGIKQSTICNNYFPQTTNLLETSCPHRMAGKCGLGSIYFSRLEQNTKVKEHCGPTNIRFRCHVPLIVPRECSGSAGKGGRSCLLVGLPGVSEEIIGWEEGVPILFDDSFLHSAVHLGNNVVGENESHSKEKNHDYDLNGARIVLIVDFWHPALSEADRNALGVLYPPGS